jgi:hypothetical protein
MYVVVLAGVTILVPVMPTKPIPLSIKTEVAPETLQLITEDCPLFICIGSAVNKIMNGEPGVGMTATTADAVNEPAGLVAVKT